MSNGCWICKKWKEHFYWDHFEESNFHFMKVMDGDFAQKMEFPRKFIKYFRVELIDVVALEAPNGNLWEIGLCKEQDNLYFSGGWKEFIEANEIKKDYILVFKYAGDSSFRVLIFDDTGFVRPASNLIDKSRAKQKNEYQTWNKFKKAHSSRLCEQVTDDKSSASARIFADKKYGMCEVKDDGRVGSSRICNKELSEEHSYSKSEAKISLRCSQDLVKILEHKAAGKEGTYSFVKLITQSNLISIPFMAIPIKFVSKHLRHKPYGITVYNRTNKKWHVNCNCRGPSFGFYGKSLFKLLQENYLQKGDACIFELKEKRSKVIMEMSVVRAKEVCSILKKYCF